MMMSPRGKEDRVDGIAITCANFVSFLYTSRDLKLAVYNSSESHSRIRDVCVIFRTRTTGFTGSCRPNFVRMFSCKSQNSCIFFSSSSVLRFTVILTILPDDTPLGNNKEGNSMRWWSSVKRMA